MFDRVLRGRRPALVAVGAALFLLAPSAVQAHAELVSATPEDGATVEGTPAEIVATFDEALVDGSTIHLHTPNDEAIADGIIDPDDGTRMIITDLPELTPGEYEVRWQSKAEDGDIEHDTWSFTVVAAPTPTPTTTPTPTVAASAEASAPASAPVSPSEAAASPSQTPDGDGTGATGTSDVLLPIIVALAVVAAGGGWLLSRRRQGRSDS